MGLAARPQRLELRGFVEDLVFDASVEAQARGINVEVSVEEDLSIQADPRLLRSAISNLLHNAVKFTGPKTTVTLRARRDEGRVVIDVADQCGGLPAGKVEELFSPLVQRAADRSGFGLGLAIAKQATAAHDGIIRVRDVPGVGCVFTLDLPSTP